MTWTLTRKHFLKRRETKYAEFQGTTNNSIQNARDGEKEETRREGRADQGGLYMPDYSVWNLLDDEGTF